MKNFSLLILYFLLVTVSYGQVKVIEGPALDNEVDNKMNRMIEGENGAFYSYRIKTKGKGTTYLIEKFNEADLKTAYSKDVEIPSENAKVLEVRYFGGKVFVFYRSYDKENDKMTLFYKTVSTQGVVSKASELLNRKTDHYEYIDFDITGNKSKSKIAVKVCYKANKEDQYKTDFVLFDGASEKTVWTKTVNQYLKKSNPWFQWSFSTKETTGFLGLLLEDNDDIFYAYNDKTAKDDKKDLRYNAAVEFIKAGSQTPVTTKLDLNPEYLVYDVQFAINNQKQVIIAGFFKDVVERKGRDLVDVGVFNFKINSESGKIEGKSTKIFDEKILAALESNQKRARGMNYKVDYVIPSGDDFYLVGEQYTVTVQARQQNAFSGISNIIAISSGANPFYVGKDFNYEYMDVIVAKINAKGEFEWITNSPLRNGTVTSDNPHVFKQYIALLGSNGLYLLYNEHPKNVERLKSPDYVPKDLKTQYYIHGSNLVYSKIDASGKLTHDVAYKNETYCFAPIQERNIQFMPPEDAEIFVPGKQNEIFIYTEDKGKGKFCRLALE